MKHILSFLLLVIPGAAFAQSSTSVDYSKITSSQISELKHHSEFLDKRTNETRRVINAEVIKGIEVELTKNGKSEFVRDGAFYTYSNGSLTTLVTYKYGKKDGVYERYNKDGVVVLRQNYKDGIREGAWESRSDNSVLLIEGNYVSGEKQGVEIRYDETSGLVRAKVDYVNGDRDGSHIQYQEGKKYSTTTFKEGAQVGKTLYH